ncbi:hypothetical protein AAF712_012477 [Marasmius tenuissimus]|uniref:Uncharacterized protein n=1 Tax=Marasmius tenuissimus TaxID=585030 RepID=A0ABR2ZHC3_9AGAR
MDTRHSTRCVHKAYGCTPSDDVMKHLKQEVMQAVWDLIMDEEFLDAYKESMIIRCADKVRRRFLPKFFSYSVDYPKKGKSLRKFAKDSENFETVETLQGVEAQGQCAVVPTKQKADGSSTAPKKSRAWVKKLSLATPKLHFFGDYPSAQGVWVN